MLNASGRVTHETEAAGPHCCGSISRKFLLWFLCLVLVCAAAGCASTKAAGVYENVPSSERKKVLEEIKKNLQDYTVYCDGPISYPGAVIFDPKNDDRNLIGYHYVKLTKQDDILTAIVWIEFHIDFHPSLYKVFDEEKVFYGYVLLAGYLPVPKRLNEKTLELPPFESRFFKP
jgi:hypothetical protein